MYVAVKGGERAIENAHALLAAARRGDPAVPELGLDQISEQLALAVDRVMSEGSLYDRALAALAIKQARGDMIEAIFLIRAYRTTLARFGTAAPIDTAAMDVERRISATFKDLPGVWLMPWLSMAARYQPAFRSENYAMAWQGNQDPGFYRAFEELDKHAVMLCVGWIEVEIPGWAISTALGWLVGGAITGFALVKLLRHPIREATEPQQGESTDQNGKDG